ncbi:MAG: hypothetical protein KDA85_02915 [Planctomycetaceae bacterium]|nr:hypothetical protein [Planctomycetaceae bacterium]
MEQAATATQWLHRLCEGDDQAVHQLWNRYFAQLVALTRRRLGNSPRSVSDEEDIVLSAMKSFCVRLRDGRFHEVASEDNLWRILLTITLRKIADKRQYEQRDKRDVRRQLQSSAHAADHVQPIERLFSRELDPLLAAECTDEIRRLLDLLENDNLKQAAVLKMEGFTNSEIADQLNCSLSSVERRLRTIRAIWSSE